MASSSASIVINVPALRVQSADACADRPEAQQPKRGGIPASAAIDREFCIALSSMKIILQPC
jgi:hypothetical protein